MAGDLRKPAALSPQSRERPALCLLEALVQMQRSDITRRSVDPQLAA